MRFPSVLLATAVLLLGPATGVAVAEPVTDTAIPAPPTTDPAPPPTTEPATDAPTSAPVTTEPAATTVPATDPPTPTAPVTAPTTVPVTTIPTTEPGTTAPTETTVPATSTAPPPVYYNNCGDVHAAGHMLLWWGEPGYRDGLDRDDDGMACEFGDRPGHSHHWREHRSGDHHAGSDNGNSGDSITQIINNSDASDNDGRTIVDHTPDAATILNLPLTAHTQWQTVPVGSINTGDGTA